MAEYSNFVGETGLVLTKKEINMVALRVYNELLETFADMRLTADQLFDKPVLFDNTTEYGYSLSIYFPLKDSATLYVQSKKYRCKTMIHGFLVTVAKRTGYLDVGDGQKDYENAPAYMWSVSVVVNGTHIPYRHKTTEGIGLEKGYLRDTDLFNISLRETLLDLWAYMNGKPLNEKDRKKLNPDLQ